MATSLTSWARQRGRTGRDVASRLSKIPTCLDGSGPRSQVLASGYRRAWRASRFSKAFRLALLVAAATTTHSRAATDYIFGTVTRYTSGTNGLMLMIDGGALSTNCTGSPYGWMSIGQANKAMMAAFLAAYYLSDRSAAVYTQATAAGQYCVVTRFDSGGY